jgi:hypothetical protein
VALGAVLLIKGGGVGFDKADTSLSIESDGGSSTDATTTTTTEPPPATSVAPSALKVVVLNGAGINGYAASAQQFLGVAGGYTGATAATAATQVQTTSVYYAPGYEADAAAIAKLLGLGRVGGPAAPRGHPAGPQRGRCADGHQRGRGARPGRAERAGELRGD